MSKWDYQKWEKEGKPYLDQAGWAALCMTICEKDLVNLEKLFKVSEKLLLSVSVHYREVCLRSGVRSLS